MGWEFFIFSTQCIKNVIWSKMLLKCQLQFIFLMCKGIESIFHTALNVPKFLIIILRFMSYCFSSSTVFLYTYFLFIISRYVLWLLWLRKQEQNGRKKLFLLHGNILKLKVKLKSYDCWRFPPGVKIMLIGHNTL